MTLTDKIEIHAQAFCENWLYELAITQMPYMTVLMECQAMSLLKFLEGLMPPKSLDLLRPQFESVIRSAKSKGESLRRNMERQ